MMAQKEKLAQAARQEIQQTRKRWKMLWTESSWMTTRIRRDTTSATRSERKCYPNLVVIQFGSQALPFAPLNWSRARKFLSERKWILKPDGGENDHLAF